MTGLVDRNRRDPGSHLVLLQTDVLWEDPPSLTDAKGSAVKISDRLSPVASTTVACTKNGQVTPEAEKQIYTYTYIYIVIYI